MERDDYDVIIVGAGPAGLSAGLVLGRCRERVLVLDDGLPRNRRSHAAHGFYTRDGAAPELLRCEALAQLEPYDVRVETACVTKVCRTDAGFVVAGDERTWRGRKLLLATGLREDDAQIQGLTEHLGRGVYCCPYCDGWELRDLALGGLITGEGAAEYGLALQTWSERVTLFTHGPAQLSKEERATLERNRVSIVEKRIERVVAADSGRLRGVELGDGELVRVDALFLHAGQYHRSKLAQSLGCEEEDETTLRSQTRQQTNVPGLFVAGDAAAHVSSIVVAAADGYKAALAIHSELRRERTL